MSDADAGEEGYSVEYATFRKLLDERAGERSELSRNAKTVGRKLAHLPD